MQDYVFDYNEYKKRTKKPVEFNFSLTIFFVIILLGLCVFLNQPKLTQIEYNFVEIGQFATYSQASKTAQNLSAQNGAGFVYFDNCYHVFAGFYTTKTDAEKVAKNIVEFYPNAVATTISATQFKTKKSLSKSQNLATKNLINITENTINTLSKLSIDIDSNNISSINIGLKLEQIKDNFSSALKSFNTAFDGNKNNRFDIVKYFTEIENSLTNIKATASQDLPQKIKYELINIVVNHIRFLQAIA